MDVKHPPRKPPKFIGILLLILLCIQSTSIAQDDAVPNAPPTLTAAKLIGTPPRIDGDLDEDTWQQAPVATGFVQLLPDEGKPATERSEVRVLYGDDALYVGFRAYDTNSTAIEGQLTRRDRESFSAWVHVAIDSYNDKRTAFQFGVNPRGVKQDTYRYDDTRRDPDWNAVWDVATIVDEHGWTAEFRIPYTQLRFPHTEKMIWGIQFTRDIARKKELVYWAPLSSQESGTVSKYGTLRGLKDIQSQWRFEVAPYSLGRFQRASGVLS
ncbi:MAG: carbohydrate binding family 9 domain-containing protein [Candidatus Poribacteria bacterium]|nr:carbohydrate binding family 9 domain-containing protein [Candidatus Poribacteria bacterium]